MPLVRAHFDKNNTEPSRFGELLYQALREIVPAAFNSPQGRIAPGSIDFVEIDTPSYGLNVDTLIEIEAYFYEDRDANLNERAEAVRSALKRVLPEYTYAIWPKLVRAGWASDVDDADNRDDMRMEAAIKRAAFNILERRDIYSRLSLS